MALPTLLRKLFKNDGYGPEIKDERLSTDITVKDWDASHDYPANVLAKAGGEIYRSVAASGPGTLAGAQDPAADASHTYWGAIAPNISGTATDIAIEGNYSDLANADRGLFTAKAAIEYGSGDTVDLNDFTNQGVWDISYGAHSNMPDGVSNGILVVYSHSTSLAVRQILYRFGTAASSYNVFTREFIDSAWTPWYRFEMHGTNHLVRAAASPRLDIQNEGVTPGVTPSDSNKYNVIGFNVGTTDTLSIAAIASVVRTNGATEIRQTLHHNGTETKTPGIIFYRNANDSAVFFSPLDNTNAPVTLGYTGANRWSQIYSTSTTISTSDERLKANISSMPDDVLDAWGDVEFFQFQMLDSMEKKGQEARLHSGLVAQRVAAVFSARGLDASSYGLFCHDSWEAQEAELDDGGNEIHPAREAGDEYSLRYEEALCMEAAYQRRRAGRAEARISALEARLAALEAKLNG